jgi:cytochrome P450
VSETISTRPYTLSAGPSWKALTTALRGDALGAFPSEAFEQKVVVHRLLGRSQFIINRPEAIRHILVENAGNYVRPAPTIRVLRPLFGSGLFLSAGEEWKQQRRTVAPAFAPRAARILARHVAIAAHSLVTDLKASNNRPIQLVPVLQRLALEVIGSAMFSLEMNRYGAELCHLILSYASSLGRPTLLDLMLPLRIPTPYDLGRRRFRRRWIALIRRIVVERGQQSCGGSHRDLFDLVMAADTDRSTLDADAWPIGWRQLSWPATRRQPPLFSGRYTCWLRCRTSKRPSPPKLGRSTLGPRPRPTPRLSSFAPARWWMKSFGCIRRHL